MVCLFRKKSLGEKRACTRSARRNAGRRRIINRTVWDASFGTPLSELKSSTPYRLHFRMRSRYEGPISLGISDVEQPFLPRGLVRFFSPASQWQSYDFDFVTTTSDLPASLAIYIAAHRFEVDMEDFD